jgi:hypothetical protein
MIANDGFAGANVHRTLDRIQSALFRSLLTLRMAVLAASDRVLGFVRRG